MVSMIFQNRHVDLLTGVNIALEDTFENWQYHYLAIVDEQRIAIGKCVFIDQEFPDKLKYYT